MTQTKVSGRQALLRAVSALGVALGVTTIAVADEAPKEIGSATSGAGAGKSHQLKYDSNQLKYQSNHIKGESNQLKGESHQLKGESNQIKGESNQLKYDAQHTGAHSLNPQPEPPG